MAISGAKAARALQRPAAADHQEPELAGGDPSAERLAGLDDDLGPDPGRVAHGDREMPRLHLSMLPMGRPFCARRSRQSMSVPKAPDFETTSRPSQPPPRMTERGTPGATTPVVSRDHEI